MLRRRIGLQALALILAAALPLACGTARGGGAPGGETGGTTELPAGSRARLLRLATTFDHVVVHLGSLAEWCGGGLPAAADGIVLVIAAETTRRQAGRIAAERLRASGAPLLGAVLTNRRYVIPDAIYRRL